MDRSLQEEGTAARGGGFPGRVLAGEGGFPRRSGVAVACALLGLVALVVVFVVLFAVSPGSLVALVGALIAMVSGVCGVLSLFRDWGRARLGAALVLFADIVLCLMVDVMVFRTELPASLAAVCLVVVVVACVAGAVLILSAPRRGKSSTPRAVEPKWSH